MRNQAERVWWAIQSGRWDNPAPPTEAPFRVSEPPTPCQWAQEGQGQAYAQRSSGHAPPPLAPRRPPLLSVLLACEIRTPLPFLAPALCRARTGDFAAHNQLSHLTCSSRHGHGALSARGGPQFQCQLTLRRCRHQSHQPDTDISPRAKLQPTNPSLRRRPYSESPRGLLPLVPSWAQAFRVCSSVSKSTLLQLDRFQVT